MKQAYQMVQQIISDIEARGDDAIIEYALLFKDVESGQPLVVGPDVLAGNFYWS